MEARTLLSTIPVPTPFMAQVGPPSAQATPEVTDLNDAQAALTTAKTALTNAQTAYNKLATSVRTRGEGRAALSGTRAGTGTRAFAEA